MTYLEGLSDTEDDRDTALNGGLGLAGNELLGQWLVDASFGGSV